VLSLDLSNNSLGGVHLSGLPRYLNQIANLSLANNNISYGELDMMSGRKERMPQLRELILAGNPIRDLDIAKGKADSHRRCVLLFCACSFYDLYYLRSTIAGIFPSLNVLDGEPIAKIAFDVPESSTSSTPVTRPTATTFPEPMGGSLIAGVDGGMVAGFLMKYVPNLLHIISEAHPNHLDISRSSTLNGPFLSTSTILRPPSLIMSTLPFLSVQEYKGFTGACLIRAS